MIAVLEKSDAAQGFEQIIDFLSGSYIHHAIIVNPHVYISYIKQFWNTAVVKRSGDVTRLQALVDKKRIVITEEVVREILQLDDAEGVETPLFKNMLTVRAVDAEEEVQVPAQDDVAHENVIEDVAAEVFPLTLTSPSPPSPVLEKCSALALRVKGLENANVAQQWEIVNLKARVKKLERMNKLKSSKLRRLKKIGTSQRIESSEDEENVFNQGRISVDIDEGIELEIDQEKDAEIEGRQADTQAEIYNIDLNHCSKVLSMQEDTKVQEAVKVVSTAKLITKVVTAAASQVAAASTPISAAKPKVLRIAAAAPAVSTRKRKGVVIRDPEEELHDDTPAEPLSVKDKGKELEKVHGEAYKNIDCDTAYDHVQSKGTQYIKRYHGFKKKPESESEARKNIIAYLKNNEDFKMAYFKGKTYDQILPIFQARFDANLRFLFKSREEMEREEEEIIKSINETPAQKAAKRRKKQTQEADALRGHLEIVPNEDDDVFVEAVPLAQKAPIMNYQDAIWRSQKSVHGLSLVKRWKLLKSCGVHVIILSTVQLFLLVEKRYPLPRFTLEQLVNVARLQLLELMLLRRSEKNTKCVGAANKELTVAVVKRSGDVTRVGKGFSGVETPLFKNMLAVRAVDAEEEVQVPAQDDIAQENVIQEVAAAVVLPTPTSPSPPSPVIPSTPPHQSPSPPQSQAAEGSSTLVQQVLEKCSALVLRVEGLENANAAQQLEIVKLKARVKKLERLDKVKSSKLRRLKKVGTSQRIKSSEDEKNVFNQGRISVDIDEGIELEVDQEKVVEIEGRQANTQAEIYNIDLDHSSKVLSMQEDTEVQEAVEVVTAAATQVAAASTPISAAKPKVLRIAAAALAVSTRKRKGVVIRDPEEELHDDTPAQTLSVKDKGKGILVKDPKPMKKKDQIEMDAEYAKRLQEEELEKGHEEAYKNID
nr:hypothetical protein [Tanacetum cinerariifolium]